METIKRFLDHLLEQSAPDKPAWNLEVVQGHIPPSWNYIEGCMLKAVLEMHAITGESAYLDFAEDFINYYVDDDGVILGYRKEEYNCDNINEGKVLFQLDRLVGKKKYRAAIQRLYDQLRTHPRTVEGSFWHKKIYPNQVWLDGLYMVQPFYMEYEHRYNQNRDYQDCFRQFQIARDRMRDPASGLLYHGYDASRESFWADPVTGCSPCFWTRSLGWYCMALVDTLEVMDQRLFLEHQTLQDYLRDIADALLAVMDGETELFYQVTDQGGREGNYLETSGSCAIAYSLMKGARLGYLPVPFLEQGDRIFRSVVEHKLKANGDKLELQDICLVAGLGGMPGLGEYKVRDGSFAYYISEPRVNNDAKGVAPFLLAFTESYRKELRG